MCLACLPLTELGWLHVRGFAGAVLRLAQKGYNVVLVLPENQGIKKALVAAARQGAVFSWSSVAAGSPRQLCAH